MSKTPAYERSARYLAAVCWYEQFLTRHLEVDADGNPVLDQQGQPKRTSTDGVAAKLAFAEATHRQCLDTHKLHDDRANFLFQSGTVLTAGLVTAVNALDIHWSRVAPAMACFALTVLLAVIAKTIATKPWPMGIDVAMSLAGNAEAVQTVVAASLHVTTEGYMDVLDRKARWCNWASVCCVLGIMLSGLLLIA